MDDVLLRPVTPVRLRRKLERAIDAVHSRRVIRQLEDALSRKGDELSELNKIGVALSAERDIDQLLELILSKSREITGADAGSLYLVERAKDRGNGERRPAALQAGPERLGGRALRGVDDAPRRDLDRRLRRAHRARR